ncbi:tryptophan-rich sensory protein [Maribius pontilimi]|uniref:Tryptophan-rich sensory protein n=1 Tax=Palleronia pontilimi TaxID=1964209 RepID=A0A934IEV6_9RHOB|nr:TspO/MBR family protein [Palleronia pontilimi]MBJ3761456.1 tryptophan-rich sensory protein [Palleronia pontilimi]
MDWTLFLIFLAACGGSAATGAMFQPGQWYDALAKPSWNPPNWVFPVTWTVLYLCIANAGARVAQEDGNAYAMGFFAVQIAFNTLWTPVFFGLHRMKAAMVVIICLWLAVAATTIAFWQLNLIAGILFIPYLVWVSIAAALNFEVWRLNRHTPIVT